VLTGSRESFDENQIQLLFLLSYANFLPYVPGRCPDRFRALANIILLVLLFRLNAPLIATVMGFVTGQLAAISLDMTPCSSSSKAQSTIRLTLRSAAARLLEANNHYR